MISYFTRIKTNDAALIVLLGEALSPAWKMIREKEDILLELKVETSLIGSQLYIDFMGQLKDLKKAVVLIKGGEPISCEIHAPERFWREEGDQEIDVPVWITGVGNITMDDDVAFCTGQVGGSTHATGQVIPPHLTSEEIEREKERQSQVIAQGRVRIAQRRLMALGFSDRYRQVREDWERQGEPDVRALFVYVENMTADISKNHFNKNGLHKELADDFEAFKCVANNPRHYGIDARHGWGYHDIQPYNKKFEGMTKKKMLEFAAKMLDIWEEHLETKAKACMAAKIQLDIFGDKAPNGS